MSKDPAMEKFSRLTSQGSLLKKRSVMIARHATSITLEAPFWEALKRTAAQRGQSLNALIAEIDAARGENNLSSALRLYVLQQLTS